VQLSELLQFWENFSLSQTSQRDQGQSGESMPTPLTRSSRTEFEKRGKFFFFFFLFLRIEGTGDTNRLPARLIDAAEEKCFAIGMAIDLLNSFIIRRIDRP